MPSTAVARKAESTYLPEPWAAAVAWIAVLLASDFHLVLRHVAGADVPLLAGPLLRMAALVAIALLVFRLPHLRGFVLALAAMLAGDWVASEIQARIGWFHAAARADRMLAGVFLTLIPALFMAGTLAGGGLSRRDLFLVRGNMRAASTLPWVRGARWSAIAPLLLVLISGGLIVQLWIVSNASRHFRPGMLLAGVPAALLFAAINAACEEFRFRCVLLARGVRCLGATQVVATTSILFGLAHFGGHPSGFTGMAMAAFFAWLLAKSMLDTGGWGWAWLLHFVQDVIIFLMVLMTGV